MSKLQLRKFSGNFAASLGFFQIFLIRIVDFCINIKPFFGRHKVGVSNPYLRHDGNCLGIRTGLFRIHLRTVCLIAGNVLRQFQQIVRSADSEFPPGAVVEKTVVAVREINKHPDIREHHHDGFAAFQHINVLLHVNFIKFRPLHQCDLLHEFHFRKGELRHIVENRVIHFNLGIRVKSKQ